MIHSKGVGYENEEAAGNFHGADFKFAVAGSIPSDGLTAMYIRRFSISSSPTPSHLLYAAMERLPTTAIRTPRTAIDISKKWTCQPYPRILGENC